MSAHSERKEKICLNCQASLIGRYCHQCGQENRAPRESTGELIAHFFNDLTHFDSKFFRSVRLLFLHPGKLPRQYMEGKRAGNLNPVRMYVFTSALFFLILYTLFTPSDKSAEGGEKQFGNRMQWERMRQMAYAGAENRTDSVAIDSVFNRVRLQGEAQRKGVDAILSGKKSSQQDSVRIADADDSFSYDSIAQYERAQAVLPSEKRDGWFIRQLVYKKIRLAEKYDGDVKRILLAAVDRFIHLFPYLLFLSLPLFALFLKLIYLRHKELYFVDHLIFLIYLYIFTFLFLLLFFGLNTLNDKTGWDFISWVLFLYFLYGVYYAYRAMRNFYMQGRGKTILKFIFLNTLSSITLLFLFVLFLVISVFQI